jgi:hypothetical protein
MQTQQPNDERELVRSYLLGSLDEARLEQFELRLLSDAQLQEEVRAEQDELLDDYSFGLLTSSERERFEQYFLPVPGRADQLRFARAMKEYVDEEGARGRQQAATRASREQTTAPSRSGRKILAGLALAACILVALVVGLLVWRGARQEREARARLARAEVETEVLRWTRQPPADAGSSNRFADLTLTPGLVRESSGARRVVIAQETLAAQLRLELTDRRFERYEVTLLTDEDVVVFAVAPLLPEEDGADRVLVLRIPARFLPAGDYRLRVRGTTAGGETAEAGSYPFQVIHRTTTP